jgi:hypothetical protein
MNARGKKRDRKEREKKLDQAIEMTFPASDPIAVGRPTSTEAQQGGQSAIRQGAGISAPWARAESRGTSVGQHGGRDSLFVLDTRNESASVGPLPGGLD